MPVEYPEIIGDYSVSRQRRNIYIIQGKIVECISVRLLYTIVNHQAALIDTAVRGRGIYENASLNPRLLCLLPSCPRSIRYVALFFDDCRRSQNAQLSLYRGSLIVETINRPRRRQKIVAECMETLAISGPVLGLPNSCIDLFEPEKQLLDLFRMYQVQALSDPFQRRQLLSTFASLA